ncbi:hypothetical protein K470DRAFT_277136 [Piedraia hortae CBS 480.64]|uniref:ribonuclease Z n=1 Tax=Piedraia hortae CBS 480.64 TaxID=1314780 RepID=A0A6A7BZQ8_9PEZI|nr:hypothetical protein K470DRAFT_277136 [Piedraia hortae CBS 480.64]
MHAKLQILTTPTADTPGTTLLLQFDNKRYLIGNVAEGTQRACVQEGVKLLKLTECFITGRTEWSNIGGLVGMILTLAEAAASSSESIKEEALKKATNKARKLGYLGNKKKMAELSKELDSRESPRLSIFSPPNLNYALAAARRFIFRKGMPVDVHEVNEASQEGSGPYWADDNIKVWPMIIHPTTSAVPKNGRKRSIGEVNEPEEQPTPKQRDLLTLKAVVGNMFDSTWQLNQYRETKLGEVELPTSIFVRNPETQKVEKYCGPLPGIIGSNYDPELPVLIRKPWPGALVDKLPSTEPAKEALSYIIKCQDERGQFSREKAIALKVPKGRLWGALASGSNVENELGEIITPDMVLGEVRAGSGVAVVDLPDPSYIDGLLSRWEWKQETIMSGVGVMVWICGKGVAEDERVLEFMREHAGIQHVVSSPEHCSNMIALDSIATMTIRHRQIDAKRYGVPVQDSKVVPSNWPTNVQRAARGQLIQMMPCIKVPKELTVQSLDIQAIESETPKEVIEAVATARQVAESNHSESLKWAASLPEGAADVEIVTLGTGSALPSKYRNVSATLMRIPGWGSMLFDCGENTLGQMRRVFGEEETREILCGLRIIFISHMHADHHLGTVSVIKAWHEATGTDNKQLLPPETNARDVFTRVGGLAVVSEPAMQMYLAEYAAMEDFGLSRVAPLTVWPANLALNRPSRLTWFVPPSELAQLPRELHEERMRQSTVSPDLLGLKDIQAVSVLHCEGARAVSLTWPSGFKASYSGDCRPSKAFSEIGQGSTVCVHEATFDDALSADAKEKKHSTTSEALEVARAMDAKACLLTHFSQRYQKLPVLRDHDSDMRIAVAFDYMRLKVGDFPEMEKFFLPLQLLVASQG